MRPLIISVLFILSAACGFTADRQTVTQQVRVELAKLLKKDPAQLPVDKPVLELGADELTVVEWVMANERVFRIRIADEKTEDPKTKKTRKDLSIAHMATIVLAALETQKGGRR
jgi:acyl carrier protein